MALFGRIARVIVGQAGQPGTQIDELRISFNITTTQTSNPSHSEIQIYNLSESSRAKFNKDNLKVQLLAGYIEDTGLQLLYSGDVILVNHSWSPPDMITKLQCADGAIALRDTMVSLSYAPGSNANTIVNDVSSKLKMPVNVHDNTLANTTFPNGFSFVGTAKTAMDKATSASMCTWNIQKSAVHVVKQNSHTSDPAILLTPETGLIGKPEKLDNAGFSALSTKKTLGHKLTCLLQPKLITGGRVKVESEELNGVFIIQSVEHKGDTRGQDWMSTIEVFST